MVLGQSRQITVNHSSAIPALSVVDPGQASDELAAKYVVVPLHEIIRNIYQQGPLFAVLQNSSCCPLIRLCRRGLSFLEPIARKKISREKNLHKKHEDRLFLARSVSEVIHFGWCTGLGTGLLTNRLTI